MKANETIELIEHANVLYELCTYGYVKSPTTSKSLLNRTNKHKQLTSIKNESYTGWLLKN